jgi:hypothetical protein
MTRTLPSGHVIRQKAATELKEMAVISLYLYVCFGALLLYKSAILAGLGINFTHLGLAAIKALIMAKFMLIGRALHIGDRHHDRPLIWPTLHKSVAFLVLLAVLTAIEELVVGLLNGRSALQSLAEIGGGTRDELLVSLLIMWLILLPYFAVQSLGDVLGEGRLARLFFIDRRWDGGAAPRS